MEAKDITEIFEVPNLQELMKWTNKKLLLELKRRVVPIAEEHGLTSEQANRLVKKSFQDIQRIRYKIN